MRWMTENFSKLFPSLALEKLLANLFFIKNMLQHSTLAALNKIKMIEKIRKVGLPPRKRFFNVTSLTCVTSRGPVIP